MEDKLAAELAKQLPVKELYADAVSPAAKQSSQLLQDIVKTVQLALAPIQVLGAYQDRFRHFLDTAVRRIPEDRRVSPAPQILGPILEGIRYEEEGTPIDEMFSQLLSSSMDRARVDKAHPSYPAIIRQLSPDEAKILLLLRKATYPFVQTHTHRAGMSYPTAIETDELPRESLFFPGNVDFYMQHLDLLGLGGIYQVRAQQPLYDPPGTQKGVRIFSEYRLTDLGRRFVEACTPSGT